MAEEEEGDRGLFLLVLGVLAAIIVIVSLVALNQDDQPAATVTGDPIEAGETETTDEPEVEETEPEPEEDSEPAEEPETEVTTMWDALGEIESASQFATIGGVLGLQADLETLEDDEGNPVTRTLFAPSNQALTDFGSENIAALAGDQDAAEALVGYHFLEEVYTAEDLLELDGETLTTRTGLPLEISVVDGQVVLNGVSVVTEANFEAGNGTVHVIDTILDPPTLNQVLELGPITFEVGSDVITDAGTAELDKAVAFFVENPELGALISGHTDSDGDDELNQELSQSRADAVLAYLTENGVDGANFETEGLGESQPILVDDEEDKDASRRIELDVRQ